jgi:hypothetical protein
MSWVLEQDTTPIPVRAARPGGAAQLPDGGAGTVPVTARDENGDPVGDPRGWLVDRTQVTRDVWRRHARRFDRTGLWPLFSCRPEHLHLDHRDPLRYGTPDAAEVLGHAWEGTRLVSPDGTEWPHPPWPGLAASSGEPSPEVVVRELPWLAGDLLLVPATRPADAIARLGWYGAGNWLLEPADVAAVLRSWEDRFGAYVLAAGPADLDLVVTRPPRSTEQCRVLADEHYAFCVDNFYPQTLPEQEVISVERYAAALRGTLTWHFWWD